MKKEDNLKQLFKEMPLEEPSLEFADQLMRRIEKELTKRKRKKNFLAILPLAAAIGAIICLPCLVIYLCMLFIPNFSFLLSFDSIRFDPFILVIGMSVLFLLIAEMLFGKI